MACAIVKQAGDLFEQIVLCGDPLFLKKLCDYSQDIGLDWRRYRLNAIVGEETFTESFRDYLASVLGIDPDDPGSGLIGSSMPYGRAEVQQQFGVTIAADLAFEPEAAAVLSDGAPPPRRFAGSGYVRGLTLAGRSIAGRLQAARDLIGARR